MFGRFVSNSYRYQNIFKLYINSLRKESFKVRSISKNSVLKTDELGTSIRCCMPPRPKSPMFAPVPKNNRADYKGERYFSFMFKKHVILHHWELIPLIAIMVAGQIGMFCFMIRNFVTRSDVKWTPRSKFAYEYYDLDTLNRNQNKLFVYFQKYKPQPGLAKLYNEIRQAEEEMNA